MEERTVNHIIKFTRTAFIQLDVAAKVLGVTYSDVVEKALREYVAAHKGDLEAAHAEFIKNFSEV